VDWIVFSTHAVFAGMTSVVLRAETEAVDAFLTDVKTAASLAAVDCQLIPGANAPGRAVPEFERDAVPVRGSPVIVKDSAARRIGAGEDQLSPCHGNRPSCLFAAGRLAIGPRRTNALCRDSGVRRDVMRPFSSKRLNLVFMNSASAFACSSLQ
jgi:hypothetical protein